MKKTRFLILSTILFAVLGCKVKPIEPNKAEPNFSECNDLSHNQIHIIDSNQVSFIKTRRFNFSSISLDRMDGNIVAITGQQYSEPYNENPLSNYRFLTLHTKENSQDGEFTIVNDPNNLNDNDVFLCTL